MRYMIHSFLFNFNSSKSKTLQIQIQYGKTRQLVMNSSGEIQYYQDWYRSSPLWWAPRDQCSLSNACGKFGSCNANNGFMCKCLPGFEPVSPDGWKTGKFSSGCTRKSPEEYAYQSYNLFVGVPISDIESTVRSCETCGSNKIPYPLSTGSKCGDPMYSSFICDNVTGQVLSKVAESSYRVSSINPQASKFVIQLKS
ncbi:hypothetical protein VitviT2T_018025 [Vitis vinifera]|uniref:EGF-like domain-containing protein n=1 Tax=Vitis vinifera TaxID=29760 RepID=A0ABY9CWU5_VITVI|nr:hypothetical protein VitviT2T_018025 [Vitis vinifera]